MQPISNLSDAIRAIEWHDPSVYELEEIVFEIDFESDSDLEEKEKEY